MIYTEELLYNALKEARELLVANLLFIAIANSDEECVEPEDEIKRVVAKIDAALAYVNGRCYDSS